jgi:hypothetical protein
MDPGIVRRRIRSYHAGIARVVKPFRYKIFTVDSSKDIDLVVRELDDVLHQPLPEAPENPSAVAAEPEAAAPAAAAAPAPQVRVVDRRGLCVACVTAPADFLAAPCGHQCCCEECFQHIQRGDRRCPICRSTIQSIVRVFQSGVVNEDAGTDEIIDRPQATATPATPDGKPGKPGKINAFDACVGFH